MLGEAGCRKVYLNGKREKKKKKEKAENLHGTKTNTSCCYSILGVNAVLYKVLKKNIAYEANQLFHYNFCLLAGKVEVCHAHSIVMLCVI